jgi:L-threonylcarbamoyladenylate synthase
MNQYIDFKKRINDEKLKEVANNIKEGGIAIFPTETVYGIGADGLNENAVKKIYDIKKRPLNKPISLLVSSFDMINQITQNVSTIEKIIMEKFFPGPLTIVLEKKSIIPDIVTSGQKYVGIRMPEGEIAKKLIEYVRKTFSYT